MVMEYLIKRAAAGADKGPEDRPDWVSDRNASAAAWQCVQDMKREKALYIRRHRTPTDFLVKKNYLINVRIHRRGQKGRREDSKQLQEIAC